MAGRPDEPIVGVPVPLGADGDCRPVAGVSTGVPLRDSTGDEAVPGATGAGEDAGGPLAGAGGAGASPTSCATGGGRRPAMHASMASVGATSFTVAAPSSVASSPPSDGFGASAPPLESFSIGSSISGTWHVSPSVSGRRGRRLDAQGSTSGWKSMSPARIGSSYTRSAYLRVCAPGSHTWKS